MLYNVPIDGGKGPPQDPKGDTMNGTTMYGIREHHNGWYDGDQFDTLEEARAAFDTWCTDYDIDLVKLAFDDESAELVEVIATRAAM